MSEELLGWLCGAFGVCVIVGLFAAVGHILWLLAAALWRGVISRTPRVWARCPHCKAELAPLETARCLQCDWPRKTPLAGAELTPHRELARRIVALWCAGKLDTAACKVVVGEIAASLDAAVVAQRRSIQAAPLPLADETPTPAPADVILAEAVAAEVVPEEVGTIPLAPAESAASQLFEKHRSVAERAAQYAAKQAAQALHPAAQPLPPPKPRRPWSQVLAGFLEERNIRWGELVGGLLIVCCSIALVISFWSEIAERPLVKFLVFNGVTAVLFILGLYADRRWKLPSTSQGLLLTASLLTPLNFLAIAAFSRGPAPTDPFVIGGELVTIGLFAWLLWLAGRTLVAQAPYLLATGVLIPAASQLLIRRFVQPETGALAMFALGLLPTLAFAGSTTALSVRSAEGVSRTDHAHQLLRLLGAAFFAVLPPLGLLLYRSEAPGATLARLPSLLVLVGAPLAACGVALQRDPLLKDGKLKVVGTSLAGLGALVMLGSVVAGWPQPAGMVPAALLNFVLLTATALLFRSASAHLVAGPCFGLAYLLLVHVLRQTLGWQVDDAQPTVRALVSAASGTALVPVAVIYAALALGLPSKTGTWQRVAFGGLALLTVGVSVALVTAFGFRVPGDPHGVTWVYAGYSAALLGTAIWLCRKKESARERLLLQALTWIGAALAVPACIQFACYAHPELVPGRHKLLAAWSGLTTLLAIVACVNGWVARRILPAAQTPAEVLRTATKLASALTAALVAQAVVQEHYLEAAVGAGLLAGVWLLFAWIENSPALLAAGQVGAACAATFAVGHGLAQRGWWGQAPRPWLDPWTWQAVGLALAGLNFLWVGLRVVCTRAACRADVRAGDGAAPPAGQPAFWQRAAGLLAPPHAPADRAITAVLVLGLAWLCTYAVLPGAAQEMSPRLFARSLPHVVPENATPLPGVVLRVVPDAANFEFLGIAHAHAAGYGSWLLGGALFALLVLSLWTSYELLRVPALLLVLFLAAPLAAAQWEGQVAAGAALRWFTALAFLGVSSLIWARERFARLAAAAGCPLPPAPRSQLAAGITAAVLLPILPLVALLAFVCLAALQFRPVAGDLAALWQALAIVFVLGGALALLLRAVSSPWAEKQRFWAREQFASLGRQAGNVLAVLCTLPLAAVTLFVVAAALQGNPVVGPDPGSWFARIGTLPSYAAPPLLLAVTLLGYALRERSAPFAYSSALVFNVSATAAYALFAAQRGLAAGPAFWVRMAQVNALVAALFALSWQTVRWRAARRAALDVEAPREPLLASLAALAAVLVGLPVVWSGVNLWWQADAGPLQQHVGDWVGWLTLFVVAAAWWWVFRRREQPFSFSPAALAFLAWGVSWQVAFALAPWELGDLRVFRGVLLAQPLAGAAALALAWRAAARAPTTEGAASSPRGVVWPLALLLVCQTLWALRSLGENALVPWWTIAGLLLAAALACAVAARQTQRRYLAWAFVLCLFATFCYWGHRGRTPPFNHLTALLALEAMTCAAFGLVCTALEVLVLQPRRGPARRVPCQQVVGWITIACVALCAASGIVGDIDRNVPIALTPFSLGALALAAAAIAAGFFNPQARGNLVQAYALGLAAVGIGVDLCNLPSKWLPWTGAIVLSAYTVATGFLFSRRRGLRTLADSLHIPRTPGSEASGLAWLVPLTLLLSLHVVALAAWSVLTLEDLPMRLAAGKSAIAQLLAAGLLARGSRQTQLRYLALILGAAGAVLWAWAWQTPGQLDYPLLERLIAAVGALAATIAIYGLGIVRLLPKLVRWHRAARLLTPALVALAGLALFCILGAELWAVAKHRDLQLSWASKLTVLLALVGTTASALVAALVPGRDPLGLSERGRTLYVYAAEALLALAVLHVRLTMPWLFRGTFQRYWPLLVVLTAFVGVGLSEVFRRQARRVLYEPLERTGAFLPLLPVVAFWLTPSGTHYSLLLVCVGLVYATLAVLRKSFGFGILAALAANGGLWYLLAKQGGLGLLQHPQLWIIPPAACVLAAAYFNRKQLAEKEFVAVRYGAAIAIYTSSTADVFLNGVAQAPWLPLVLAGLSLAGIFAGILLRVRAFLMLGTSFLLLSLLTVIWHAAVDLEQTWLWYATGLVAGILIIAVFALFEKKRQEMLALLDRFKHWSP